MPRGTVSQEEEVAQRLETGVVRKEKGKGYCVKSEKNPDWNGGCYPTRGEAEKRLNQVEYFKHRGSAVSVAFNGAPAATEVLIDGAPVPCVSRVSMSATADGAGWLEVVFLGGMSRSIFTTAVSDRVRESVRAAAVVLRSIPGVRVITPEG